MDGQISIRYVEFDDVSKEWWRDSELRRQLLHVVTGAGFCERFSHYCVNFGEQPHVIGSMDQLVDAIASWNRESSYEIFSNPGEADVTVGLDCFPGAMQFDICFSHRCLESMKTEFLDRVVQFFCGIHDALGGKAVMGPTVDAVVGGVYHPRPRPPRMCDQFAPTALINVICTKFQQSHERGSPEICEKLLAASIPEGVQRKQYKNLIIFRWAESLDSIEHLRERMSLQEQFAVDVIDPPLDPGYNEAGDERVFPPKNKDEAALVTFYDPAWKIGYKGVLIDPDGSIDEELFAELAAAVEAKQLPDGIPLETLHLILPNRQSCLDIIDRAKAIGVNEVYYPDNDGGLWNPFPVGIWRDGDGVLYVDGERKIWHEYPPPA